MVKKSRKNLIGAWAFLIGVILAIVLGLFSTYLGTNSTYILWILVVLGIIVGLLNITGKESSKFLLVSLALVIVSYMGQGVLGIIPQIGSILSALLVLFVPATIIVALRNLFDLAKI
jgi:hypothetical protein